MKKFPLSAPCPAVTFENERPRAATSGTLVSGCILWELSTDNSPNMTSQGLTVWSLELIRVVPFVLHTDQNTPWTAFLGGLLRLGGC